MFIERTKYYSGFKMAQSTIIFSGIGYSGVDSNGNHKFDKVESAGIRKVELDVNPKVKIQVTLYF